MSSESSPASATQGSLVEPRERYQLSGLDPRERGFTRPVEFEARERGYQAVLRYEALRVRAPAEPTQAAALQALIRELHAQGFRQLKSQLSFRDDEYFGSRELWVEYQDPPPLAAGWWERFTRWAARTNRSRTPERRP